MNAAGWTDKESTRYEKFGLAEKRTRHRVGHRFPLWQTLATSLAIHLLIARQPQRRKEVQLRQSMPIDNPRH